MTNNDVGIFDPLKAKREVLKSSTCIAEPPQPTTGDPLADDFRVFLTLIWRFLGLPDPTELQLDVAWFMQHHKRSDLVDRLVVMAFRGMAKSFITAAFALWKLYRDPQMKVGVFSGSGKRSVAFVNFCISLINEVPELRFLRPKPTQRQSSSAFDVGPAKPDQTPSLFAAGITSQIVGFRADLIVGDDVETNTNSLTSTMREKIADAIKEFDAIIKPNGQIIFLGTPQTDSSIYNLLPSRGYVIRIWPARYPNGKLRRRYGDKLATYICWKLDNNPDLVGKSTEPGRFSDEDLAARELSWGKTGFALQYMLDTSLADVSKFPLKLMDVTVMHLDHRVGPDVVSWGSGEHLQVQDIQPIALDGDRLYGPSSVSESVSKYKSIRGFIDISGEGSDETTLTIGGVLHSTPFILKQTGWIDGHSSETLEAIAKLLVFYNVSSCTIEEDFGGGMFAQLLRPVLKKEWSKSKSDRRGTELITERAKKVRKEVRILDILEPLFQSHRIVFDHSVFLEDYHQTMGRDGTEMKDRYSLMYQITRISREKDCLTHDDRVEGVAGLMATFTDMLGLSPEDQAKEAEERRMEELEKKFFDEADRLGKHDRESGARLRGNLRSGSQRRRSLR
ncbi:MAG: phage terminase large subunit [Rhizobiaceae bacterium]|nr:phage terminase large subunit [Rhizobiaceae bacterium]